MVRRLFSLRRAQRRRQRFSTYSTSLSFGE
jgi:hypothetical protein